MSVITDEIVKKALRAIRVDDLDPTPDEMWAALNAVLPDILGEAAKVAGRYNGCHRELARQIAEDILALSENTGAVQEKGQ